MHECYLIIIYFGNIRFKEDKNYKYYLPYVNYFNNRIGKEYFLIIMNLFYLLILS